MTQPKTTAERRAGESQPTRELAAFDRAVLTANGLKLDDTLIDEMRLVFQRQLDGLVSDRSDTPTVSALGVPVQEITSNLMPSMLAAPRLMERITSTERATLADVLYARLAADERQAVVELYGTLLGELFPGIRATGTALEHAQSVVAQIRARPARHELLLRGLARWERATRVDPSLEKDHEALAAALGEVLDNPVLG